MLIYSLNMKHRYEDVDYYETVRDLEWRELSHDILFPPFIDMSDGLIPYCHYYVPSYTGDFQVKISSQRVSENSTLSLITTVLCK